MNYKELINKIEEEYSDAENVLLLGGEGMGIDYSDAFVGIVDSPHCSFKALYDYDKCLQLLQDKEGMTWEEALEWFEYNTVRSLSYQKADAAPLFLNRLNSDEI